MIGENTHVHMLRIVSNCISYGPQPESMDIVEQRLSINSKGRVWLTQYAYGLGFPYRCVKREQFAIPKAATRELFVLVKEYVLSLPGIEMVTDCGDWTLSLDGEVFKGSLINDYEDISSCIRKTLGRIDLFIMDGNNR